MADSVTLRLYDTNLLLARELKAGETISLQLWPHYPNVDFAVRVLRDRHFSECVMPTSFVAFGTDVLGYLPPQVANIVSVQLRDWELDQEVECGDNNLSGTLCRFLEIDRWGAAIVELSGPLVKDCRDDIDRAEDMMPQPEI